MANIGDVVSLWPDVPGRGPVRGEKYVVCSKGPEHIMARVEQPDRPVDWAMLFEKNKTFYRVRGGEPQTTGVVFVDRMTVKALTQESYRTMDIKKLIDEEKALKEQMKALRADLKKHLEESEIYKAVLEKTLESREPKVSQKLARAHALKVARAAHESDDEASEDE
jgi:hypothetical protein